MYSVSLPGWVLNFARTAGFVLCMAGAIRAARAQFTYTVTDLGSGLAYDINDSGQVVGTTGNGDAFLYSNGVMQDLGSGSALGINDSGQVVGELNNQGFLYSNGSFQTIGGSGYEAFGINDNGQIVGTVDEGAEAWIYSDGSFQDIGTGAAYAINDSGQVVGSEQFNNSDGSFVAFLYSNGSTQNLSALFPNNYNGRGCTAADINNAGQVAGGYNAGAFLYSNGTMQTLGIGGAQGINDFGQVVGGGYGSNAFLYSNGSRQDLNALIDPSLGWTLGTANAINNSGQIVGYGTLDGQTHAFLLTPKLVTTPTTQTPAAPLTSLYTPTGSQLEVYNPATGCFGTGTINANLPTIVLTHGWNENPSMWSGLAESFSTANPNVNIVAWNWQSEADTGLNLGYATSRTQQEGTGLGEALVAALGSNYSQSIHFLGHSLGTLVDAEAIDVLHADDPVTPIQDTLFDDAEIANVFSTSPSWANSMPAPGSTVAIDNYVSEVGNVHSQAVNVILTQGPTDPVGFHDYPQQWYQDSAGVTASSLMGMGFQFNGSQQQAGVDPYNFIQEPSGEFTLDPVTYSEAQLAITARDAAEATEAGFAAGLTISEINAAIQIEGQAQVDIEQTSQTVGSLVESILSPKITLTKVGFVPLSISQANTGSSVGAADTSTPSSSYAWLPITIPANSEFMSLDFTFDNLSPNDFLSVGINDTSLFALEDQFGTNGVTTNTGLLNVSQWAGENVQLFLGLNASDGNNAGGTVTIDNIQFESVPEPGCASLAAGIFGTVLARRPRRQRYSRYCRSLSGQQ
jgi:probable HAF family extracellular repeat protein